jgi:hypothetical protein
MSRPSERYCLISDPVHSRWRGPCGDSYCFASCDSPDCRYQFRLGAAAELAEARALLEVNGFAITDPPVAEVPPVDLLGPDDSDAPATDCQGDGS